MKQLHVAVAVVGLLAGFATVAHTQPTISQNFTATANLSAGRETALQLFDQSNLVFMRSGSEIVKIYQWYTGQMLRADFTNADSSQETVYQFWPGTQPVSCNPIVTLPAPSGIGTQYNYFSATDTCTQTALPVPFPPAGFFDFVQQATQQGTCSANGKSGTLWGVAPSDPGDPSSLCANGNTPLRMTWSALGANLVFTTFTPGIPGSSNFCVPEACAVAPDTHDSVVLPLAPLDISIPAGASAVSKTVRVRVGNADILPSPDRPGHTIQLVASGDCPAGSIVGIPDFGRSAAGPADTVVVPGGAVKTATVVLNIEAAAWTNLNAKAPRRCTLIFTAKTVVPTSWFEPTPANNTVTVELNVTDKNDLGQPTTHESLIRSLAPVTVTLKAGSASKIMTVRPTVVNADILPGPENPGDLITVSASDGDCPAGTVGIADFDRTTAGAQNSVTVKGGGTKRGSLPLTINTSAFATTNAKSPSRCTALLTAIGPSSPDPDGSNNATKLVIDVIDNNDF